MQHSRFTIEGLRIFLTIDGSQNRTS